MTAHTDVPRMVRIATVLCAILAGSLIYFAYLPRVEGLQYRIGDAESALRSDEVAVNEMPHLREERDVLAARYAHLLRQSAEAVFLGELVSLARNRRVTLVTTSLTRPATAGGAGTASALLLETHGTIELRGGYRDLLATIAQLSAGSEIVDVGAPSLRRDGSSVDASVPITIYEPAGARNAEQ